MREDTTSDYTGNNDEKGVCYVQEYGSDSYVYGKTKTTTLTTDVDGNSVSIDTWSDEGTMVEN